MSTWFIVAQVFGVLTICFEFASYQIKDKRKYLLVNGIGGIFWTIMFIAIGMATSMSTQISLIIVGAYTTTRALVFWWIFGKDTKGRRKAGRIFLLVMVVIAITAGIYVIIGLPTREVRILQSVALVFALAFVIGQYMPGKHPVRITVFFYAIMLMLTQTPLNILYAEPPLNFRWNPMGMLIEAAKMISVLVFYGMLINRRVLVKKLNKIKAIVACEMNKLNSDSSIAELASTGIMPLADLEKLVAKMLRLELAVIDKDGITNAQSSQQQTQAVLDDLKTIGDVKAMMEKVARLKMRRLDQKPIPQLSNVQNEMKEVILGKKEEPKEVASEKKATI